MEVEMKIRGLMMDPVTNMPIVVLKDAQGTAVLPIWVGIYEANAIALEIEKVQTPRPMTHDLLRNVFLGLDVRVQESRRQRFEGTTRFTRSSGSSVTAKSCRSIPAPATPWPLRCAWTARYSSKTMF